MSMLFEKTFPSGTVVNVTTTPDGRVRVKARGRHIYPEWLHVRTSLPDNEIDEIVLSKLKDLHASGLVPSHQELRNGVKAIFDNKLTREQYDSALTRLGESGKLKVIRSLGGRGCKTQIIPVL